VSCRARAGEGIHDAPSWVERQASLPVARSSAYRLPSRAPTVTRPAAIARVAKIEVVSLPLSAKVCGQLKGAGYEQVTSAELMAFMRGARFLRQRADAGRPRDGPALVRDRLSAARSGGARRALHGARARRVRQGQRLAARLRRLTGTGLLQLAVSRQDVADLSEVQAAIEYGVGW